MEKETALKELEKSDKERSHHYSSFTDKKWGDRHNYDLMINSSLMSYEECAKLISQVFKEN